MRARHRHHDVTLGSADVDGGEHHPHPLRERCRARVDVRRDAELGEHPVYRDEVVDCRIARGLGALKLGDGRAVDGEQLGQSRRPLAAAT
jgi:hypothetical protein